MTSLGINPIKNILVLIKNFMIYCFFSGKRQGPVFASSDKKAIFEQDIF